MDASSRIPRITEAEWEVMRIIWTNGQATSSEVISILEPKMDWKQATIKTLLGRLTEKGALIAEPDGKRFIYRAAIREEDMLHSYMSGLFSRTCNRKAGQVIGELMKEKTLSFDDIRYLEEILQKKKETAVEEVECQCTKGQCKCTTEHGSAKGP